MQININVIFFGIKLDINCYDLCQRIWHLYWICIMFGSSNNYLLDIPCLKQSLRFTQNRFHFENLCYVCHWFQYQYYVTYCLHFFVSKLISIKTQINGHSNQILIQKFIKIIEFENHIKSQSIYSWVLSHFLVLVFNNSTFQNWA